MYTRYTVPSCRCLEWYFCLPSWLKVCWLCTVCPLWIAAHTWALTVELSQCRLVHIFSPHSCECMVLVELAVYTGCCQNFFSRMCSDKMFLVRKRCMARSAKACWYRTNGTVQPYNGLRYGTKNWWHQKPYWPQTGHAPA